MSRPFQYQITSDNWEQIASDSAYFANTFLAAAVRHIDTQFGEGYAQQNPALIGAFITSAATVHAATYRSIDSQSLDDELQSLTDAINRVGEAVSNLS